MDAIFSVLNSKPFERHDSANNNDHFGISISEKTLHLPFLKINILLEAVDFRTKEIRSLHKSLVISNYFLEPHDT
jgi:hypothetical protein